MIYIRTSVNNALLCCTRLHDVAGGNHDVKPQESFVSQGAHIPFTDILYHIDINDNHMTNNNISYACYDGLPPPCY